MSNTNRLTLVQIQTALLVPVTAAFIEEKLKVAPAESDKRAKFWTQAQYENEIVPQFMRHLQSRAKVDFSAIEANRPKKEKDGAAQPATAPAPTAAPAAGGFSFGSPAAAPAPAAGGFSFGAAPAAAPAAGGFSFGSPAAPAPAAGGFTFNP